MGKVTGLPWKGRAYLHKKYPGAFPLSENQIKVLEGLARNGPMNTNKLRKKIGNAYSFVHGTLRELERRKMVTLLRKERTEKGTEAFVYDLALEGILLVLQREMRKAEFDKWNHAFISKIINRYSSTLPLVFGKWNHFKETSVDEMALVRLKALVDTYVANRLNFEKGTGFLPWKEMEEQVCWFFYFTGFYPPAHEGWSGVKDPAAWLSAWKQDQEIRNYVVKELEEYQKRLNNLGILIEKSISFLQR